MHRSLNRSAALFAAGDQALFPHGQPRTVDSLVATFSTKAGILVMPENDRADRLARMRAFLEGREETNFGPFTLPMMTGVLRTTIR